MFDLKLLNFDKTVKKTKVWNQKLKNSINDGMEDVGQFLTEKIISEIIKKSPSSGPTTRYGSGGKRIVFPAKRGKSPNNDQGNLVNSIDYKSKRKDLSIVVGSKDLKSCNYGGILEEKLDRPFVVPTVKKNIKKSREILLKQIKRGGFM